MSLVLFAGVGVVIIAWLQQSLSTATRLETSINQSKVRAIMLDQIKAINLIEQPAGSRQIGNHVFQWKSEIAVAEEPQIGYPLGYGKHSVRLLKVKLTATENNAQQPSITEEIWLTAHRPSVATVGAPRLP